MKKYKLLVREKWKVKKKYDNREDRKKVKRINMS